MIAGWALDQGNFNLTSLIEILVDGQIVGTTLANQNRPDLGNAFGNPAAVPHGFTYNIPNGVSWRTGTRTISARPCGTNNNLSNSPTNANFNNCRIGIIEDEPSNQQITFQNESDLVLSPNPTESILNMRVWIEIQSNVNIEVQDLTGRGIKILKYENKIGQFSETINLSDLPSGMYLLQLKTNKQSYNKKIMVTR